MRFVLAGGRNWASEKTEDKVPILGMYSTAAFFCPTKDVECMGRVKRWMQEKGDGTSVA